MKAQSCTLKGPDEIQEKWYIVDAEGCVVGRLAARIAKILRGKTLPHYAPHQNPKVHIIVTNADKIVFTGAKLTDKVYYHHSTYRTGVKSITAGKLLAEKPEEIIRKAVHGMLPKNALGRQLERHLRIYSSGEYTGQHDAQQPEPLKIVTRQPKAAK